MFLPGLALLSRVIPQEGAVDASPEKFFPPEILYFLRGAGLTDIVHSSWFIWAFVLLFLNLILVLADRWREAWLRLLGRATEAISMEAVFPVKKRAQPRPVALRVEIPTLLGLGSDERAQFQAMVTRWAKPVFGRVRVVKDGGESTELQLVAEKGGPSVLGLCLAVIGVLIVMSGAAMDVLYGLKGELTLDEGQRASRIRVTETFSTGWPLWVRELGGSIRNFEPGYGVQWIPTESPSRNQLVFWRKDQAVASRDVRGRGSVRFEGVNWELPQGAIRNGAEMRLNLEALDRKTGKKRKLAALAQGESRSLDGASVKWLGFPEPGDLGPMAVLEYQEEGVPPRTVRIFQRHPDYDVVLRKKSRYVFSMDSTRPSTQATWIAQWSPGGDWYLVGGVLLGIGLLLWAFFHPRSYWISLNAQRVLLVAESSRLFLARKEFESLVLKLRSELANLEAGLNG